MAENTYLVVDGDGKSRPIDGQSFSNVGGTLEIYGARGLVALIAPGSWRSVMLYDGGASDNGPRSPVSQAEQNAVVVNSGADLVQGGPNNPTPYVESPAAASPSTVQSQGEQRSTKGK